MPTCQRRVDQMKGGQGRNGAINRREVRSERAMPLGVVTRVGRVDAAASRRTADDSSGALSTGEEEEKAKEQ